VATDGEISALHHASAMRAIGVVCQASIAHRANRGD
jgi:hypothetical protein